MTRVVSVSTHSGIEFLDITSTIEKVVKESEVEDGVCWLFCPHTTAGITINEGADPSVVRDIISQLNRIAPVREDYQHAEGNSPAHIKASLIGSSQIVLIENGRLFLGTWQSIFFCEFDGPRDRKLFIKVIKT